MKPPGHSFLKAYLLLGLLLIFFILLLAGCDRAITVNPVPYTSKLSIQSLITPGGLPLVSVYRTVPYFDARVSASRLVRRDVVVTFDGPDARETLTLDSAFNWVRCDYDYYYQGRQPVRAGQTYTLAVRADGETFTASATTSQRKATVDSIGYVASYQDVYGDHEGIAVTFTDPPGTGEYYRYQMSRIIPDTVIRAETAISFCSIGRPTFVREQGRTIYDDSNTDGSRQTITAEPAFKHKRGQVAYVQLLTVDRNIYLYYNNLDQQKLAQFNPFVEPVYLTRSGQFGPNAVGVFGAYVVSDSVRFVFPE